MVFDSKSGSMSGENFVDPETRKHRYESMMLNCIQRHLKDASTFQENIRRYILTPMLIGEIMPPSIEDSQLSYGGISYEKIGKKGTLDTNIIGILLNKYGVHIITGIESNINNYKSLTFDAQKVIPAKKQLDEEKLHYHCFKNPSGEFYEGFIDNYNKGKMKFYNNNTLKHSDLNKAITINHAIKKYYDEFIIGQDLFKPCDGPISGKRDDGLFKPIY